jgi:hypothetical protein
LRVLKLPHGRRTRDDERQGRDDDGDDLHETPAWSIAHPAMRALSYSHPTDCRRPHRRQAPGRIWGDDLARKAYRQPPKPTGTNLVTCAFTTRHRSRRCANAVDTEEVTGSIPVSPTT